MAWSRMVMIAGSGVRSGPPGSIADVEWPDEYHKTIDNDTEMHSDIESGIESEVARF